MASADQLLAMTVAPAAPAPTCRREGTGHTVQHFIGSFGYLAIFILMVAESACVPVPSELTMPLGGALAAGLLSGVHLSLPLVIGVGVAGNVAGSYVAWAAGLYGGRAVWRRFGRRFALGGEDSIRRSQRWFDRWGGRAVFFGRLLPVIRTFISLPAGFARMSPVRFGIYTTAGCVPWVAGLAWAGYAARRNWQHVASVMRGPTYVVAGVALLVVLSGIVLFVLRARRRRQPGQQQTAGRSDSGHAVPASAALPGKQRKAG
jgi:membrane protein DedA with SNARE-associated domain